MDQVAYLGPEGSKHEIRNPKSETNPNDPMTEIPNHASSITLALGQPPAINPPQSKGSTEASKKGAHGRPLKSRLCC
jgi:hypothetical protein